MSHYKSNLRDVEFNLFELFNRQDILGTGPFEEVDTDTAKSILAEIDRISRDELAASFEDADRNPPVYDPAEKTVTMNPAFAKSYKAWMDAEWWRLQIPEELGGQVAPASLIWGSAEFVLGANPADLDVRLRPRRSRASSSRTASSATRRSPSTWSTASGAPRWSSPSPTRAPMSAPAAPRRSPNEDGSWNIEGVKRFITSAEHDMAENIMHLVLARPVGVEGVGGPGTKGLSLFLVPKFHFDHETGELTGERNGAYVTNVEKKMGIKVSTTCEVTFGDGAPAQGWLLGEVHDGINQMFRVIENARMMVGAQGHRDAVDRLPQRARLRQGARPGRRPDAGVRQGAPRASRSPTTPTYVARC